MVLYIEAGSGIIGFIAGDDNAKYVVGKSSRPVAVGYDPVDEVSHVTCVTRKQTLRSLSLSYQKKDLRKNLSLLTS